ncbi:rhodanese-like domain-containing protein [Aquilutibacter rugosus]|uniref:rhodanese-like domain-containing protein n=1 Tax=Aquilutibacter rugosus TaxID=3115820 RepID=UPI00387802AD
MDTAQLLDFAERNMLLVGIFIGLTVAIVINEIKHLTRGYKSVSSAGLTRLLNADNGVVIDVSPKVDFDKAHINGSQNIPMADFKPDHKLLQGAKDKPVVLICRRGLTAGGAASLLKKAGFSDVSVLDGGVDKWSADGLLVVGKKGKA